MDDALEQKLASDFPTMFSTMCVECGNGWYDLVHKLCENISVIDTEKEVHVVQVKEKFGKLRFYYEHTSAHISLRDTIDSLVDAAEAESSLTCEHCGKAATSDLTTTGWIVTLCPKCR